MRRTIRVIRDVVSWVALITLIVVIARVRAWGVLAVVVGMVVALVGLEVHGMGAARRLQRREKDDPEDLVRRS